MSKRVQVGYGTGSRKYGKYGQYAGKKTGKKSENGGFNHAPTITFKDVDEDMWNTAFPNGFKPSWLNNA